MINTHDPREHWGRGLGCNRKGIQRTRAMVIKPYLVCSPAEKNATTIARHPAITHNAMVVVRWNHNTSGTVSSQYIYPSLEPDFRGSSRREGNPCLKASNYNFLLNLSSGVVSTQSFSIQAFYLLNSETLTKNPKMTILLGYPVPRETP